MNDIMKELDEMENLMTANTEAPDTEVVSTDAPSTDAPTTDAPSTEAPVTELPDDNDFTTAAPSTEAPATEPPDEIEALKNEIKELRALMKKPEKETPAPTTEAPSPETPLEDQDFLGETDIDDLINDPSSFNKLLNQVFKKGVESAKTEIRTSSETLMRSIPDIIKNNMQVVSAMKAASDEFYSKNADLKPFKKVVATVFEEIAAENPDKSYKEILKVVETETRNRLELHNKTVNNQDGPPRLPRKKGKSRVPNQPPKTNQLESELAEMDKVLNS